MIPLSGAYCSYYTRDTEEFAYCDHGYNYHLIDVIMLPKFPKSIEHFWNQASK